MTEEMKIVAVLGKYYVPKRGSDGSVIMDTAGRPVPDFSAMENNRRLAEILHVMLWSIPDATVGGFCAHMNTRRFELLTDVGEDVFQEFDRRLIERAMDAAILVPNWRDSSGTLKEIRLFNRLGRPVFEELQSLAVWLKKPQASAAAMRLRVERIGGSDVRISWLANRTAPALTIEDLWTYHHLDARYMPRPA